MQATVMCERLTPRDRQRVAFINVFLSDLPQVVLSHRINAANSV